MGTQLQRLDLHDDLVAVIAAGRELTPEYDHYLADVFLSRAVRQWSRQRSPWQELVESRWMQTLVAVACLALALVAFSFLVHGNNGRGYYDRPDFNSQVYGPDQDGIDPRWEWRDAPSFVNPPAQQIPQAPSP